MVSKKRSSSTVEDKSSKKRRKEVKETESHVSRKSKKVKAHVLKEEPVSENEDAGETNDKKDDMLPMPEADMTILFNRMEALTPVDKERSFETTIKHLDWNEIAFNNYTPEECKAAWSHVAPKVRKFRLLKEVLNDARLWLPKPWTDSKHKNLSHPKMPKRPLSQFMLFYMDKKVKVAQMYPNLDMTDLTKMVANIYNDLPPEKKAKYSERANNLREKYKKDMEIFYLDHPELRPEMEKKQINKRDPSGLGLVKPRSAKQLFIDQKIKKYEEDSDFNKAAWTERLSEEWKHLSEQKKVVWIDWAIEEENKYIEAIKIHQAENPDYKPPKFKTVVTKDEQKLKDRYSGKPKAAPNSAYSLFSSKMLNDSKVKELQPKDRMKLIADIWVKMSNEEKEQYSKKVEVLKEQYKLDYATYLESLPEETRQELLMKTQTKMKAKKNIIDNGKDTNSKPKGSALKNDARKEVRLYFPGEPHQPPSGAFELFVQSFVADTKLSASEAPRFWEMLPTSDKQKFHIKLKELKEKYIRDYKKFLKSLDEDEVAEYNALQQKNKEREAKAEAVTNEDSDNEVDNEVDDTSDSSDDEGNAASNNAKNESDADSDSDEKEVKKAGSSSESSSSSSESSTSSSSSDDSDSSSDDSDDEAKRANHKSPKKESVSDSDSSDDE